ncbi:MAG TPA: 2-succinyl-5-enolpyruvyl-6-hydroxy-3-cyclohexene-1-carboxylic-acid synthase, partial [Leptolyngbyaceae cyanobacterium M65_K2018_010]|nr:2-succinyl-5-enolpyruvyl-6-hydroxy-3-cyclohexene-1-carboxylic-acid synthase [Leptolyngbyaceae cyanobacterium M65_K2018_010]
PVLDERSAAFFALGIAKRQGRPVALVCTSGTAGANYYPAMVEAKESQVPLLVLTADRPPELRDCASGQTIDQQKLFGSFPNWYAELAIPMADLNHLCYLRQTLVQAWQRSLYPIPGPVHLNCPFRDPLAPVEDGFVRDWQDELDDRFWLGLEALADPTALSGPRDISLPAPLLEAWRSCDRGLILAGAAQPTAPEAYCQAVATLSQQLQWPVLAEALSPLRNWASLNPHLITTYDAILRQAPWQPALAVEQVIQLGPLPTSKVLRQWLAEHNPRRWVITPTGQNLDPLHGPTTPLPLSLAELVAALGPVAGSPADSACLDLWLSLEHKFRQHLDQSLSRLDRAFEGKVPWLMAQCLPAGTPLMIANSMPIRDAEWFWPPGDRQIQPFCNRGANGIDGTLSTALGIAHQGPPTVLLSGDLALLHDTNGWLTVPHFQGHLTVVLINNHGGGIFEMLPIAEFDPPFEEFFATPQAVHWNHLCAAYGVNYERVRDWEQLQACLADLPSRGVRVLELRCDRKVAPRLRQQLLAGP